MLNRSSKKRMDLNLLAKYIVDEELLSKAVKEGKNPVAVLLGRQGGLKGGKARAVSLSAEKKTEIAKKAACIRWQKNKKDATEK